MAFEKLISKSMNEAELLDAVVAEVQWNFELYQDRSFFFKLKHDGDGCSHLEWIKEYPPSAHALVDFYFGHEFHPACFMLKFKGAQYELVAFGYYISDSLKILADRIVDRRPQWGFSDRDKQKMISRELIEKAFGEFRSLVSTSRGNKAV